MQLTIVDAVLFFGGTVGILGVWLFRRDFLVNDRPRKILTILCVVLAVIGLGGCALLFSGRPTKLHFLIFPLGSLLLHEAMLCFFRKKYRRVPVDTAFTASGAFEDRAFNIAFVLVSGLLPAIVGSYLERFAS